MKEGLTLQYLVLPTTMALVQKQVHMPTNESKTPSATDMSRRMVCGGLAGMIAKVRNERDSVGQIVFFIVLFSF
jgi:hypothetical protein